MRLTKLVASFGQLLISTVNCGVNSTGFSLRLAVQFAAEDRLLWDAEAHFPGGQLQLLAHEVDAGLNAFGSMSKLEQYARLKVWIGRFRFYQASQDRDTELNEELTIAFAPSFSPAKMAFSAI